MSKLLAIIALPTIPVMKKILIIEDDADTVELISYILFENGYETISAYHDVTIAETLTINPQLILIDCYLYSALGDNFCFILKNHPDTQHFPVIMFSATNDLKEKAKQNCADGYIEKPFDLDNFLMVINQCVL